MSYAKAMMSFLTESFIGYRRSRMSLSGDVHPFYWIPPRRGAQTIVNFGDELMARTFEYLMGKEIRWNECSTYRRTVFVGGSVIDQARNGDIVWGAGMRDLSRRCYFRQLDVYAVRGPLTRMYLLSRGVQCPAVYGDPGILAGELYSDHIVKKERSIKQGVVPHFSEYDEIKNRYEGDDSLFVINPLRPSVDVVYDISKCQRIMSSSLHGIIVAEALGIPAAWWRRNEDEPIYKYYDYYLSTNRPGRPYQDLEQGFRELEAGNFEAVDIDPQVEGLKSSFYSLQRTEHLTE